MTDNYKQMNSDEPALGLGNLPKSEWPKKGEGKDLTPMERLKDCDLHCKVKDYLMDRITYSEQEMAKLKPRWRVNEKKYQAYVTLNKWEEELKKLTDSGQPPKVVSIVVPYTFATISTIVTYLIHTYAGRKPMFQVGSNKAETAASARNMELKLQYDAEHTRLIKHLFQFLLDGQQYGVGVLRCQWNKEQKIRTRWQSIQAPGSTGPAQMTKTRGLETTFEGNEICSIDPYAFLPDPRVPMSEVNKKGEWVFWVDFVGKHTLKNLEKQNKVFGVDQISTLQADGFSKAAADLDSYRSLRAGGEAIAGQNRGSAASRVNTFIKIHQGTIEIIPAELGLGDSEYPEKWLFSIANGNRIIQAQPLALDHDMHPVVVTEPYTMGYSFGHLGISDYINPVQDTMSWLVNSHMDNVRTALNNMFVFDPSRIEIQDLKQPGAGKLIRAKKAAYGTDLSEAIKQFPVQDVTQGHIRDFQLFMKIGDTMSSITDNLRGLQDSGGRKTATEVRTSGEAAASRLAAMARLISAQALTDLTEQMCLNNQQNLSDDFYIEVVGQDGLKNPIKIGPEMLTGDFQYPVNDGTLPLDRIALLDIWKEIFIGVAQDQQLRGSFDMLEMFKYIAELGGAKDITRFEVKAAPDQVVANGAAAGNLVPATLPSAGGGSTTPGIAGDASHRLMT